MTLRVSRRRNISALLGSVMKLVTAGVENSRMYIDVQTARTDYPINHVVALTTFLACLNLNKPERFPDKSRIGAARVNLLDHVISTDGVRPYDECHHSATHAYVHEHKATTHLTWRS